MRDLGYVALGQEKDERGVSRKRMMLEAISTLTHQHGSGNPFLLAHVFPGAISTSMFNKNQRANLYQPMACPKVSLSQPWAP